MIKMTEYKKRIKAKGLKQVWVAEKMNISRITLAKKLSGKSEFTKAEKYLLEAILRGEDINV